MLAQGATTIWEHCATAGLEPQPQTCDRRPDAALIAAPLGTGNAYDNPSGPAMNSHNHPALSSVGAWLYRWLAGIRLGGYGTGYQEVVFGPSVVDHPNVTALDASVASSYGQTNISWSYHASNRSLVLVTTLPANTNGVTVLPRVGARQRPEVVDVYDALGQLIMRWPSCDSGCRLGICCPDAGSQGVRAGATSAVTFGLRGGGQRRFVALY